MLDPSDSTIERFPARCSEDQEFVAAVAHTAHGFRGRKALSEQSQYFVASCLAVAIVEGAKSYQVDEAELDLRLCQTGHLAE